MGSFKIQNSIATFVIKHRAVCEEGDYTGRWRQEFDKARDDASRHMDNNPGHVAYVETKQEQNFKTAV